MRRAGSLTPREKCGPLWSLPRDNARRGYRLGRKLTDWFHELTADCPRKRAPGYSDPCAARCPDLPKVF